VGVVLAVVVKRWLTPTTVMERGSRSCCCCCCCWTVGIGATNPDDSRGAASKRSSGRRRRIDGAVRVRRGRFGLPVGAVDGVAFIGEICEGLMSERKEIKKLLVTWRRHFPASSGDVIERVSTDATRKMRRTYRPFFHAVPRRVGGGTDRPAVGRWLGSPLSIQPRGTTTTADVPFASEAMSSSSARAPPRLA
jgi:streptolysin S family bacteriocin protoxin